MLKIRIEEIEVNMHQKVNISFQQSSNVTRNHEKRNICDKTYFHILLLSAHFKAFDIPVSKCYQY